jgi:deoxyribonuclease-4
VAAFHEELERAEQLGIPSLVTHPGAHLGSGEPDGIARVAEALNVLHAALPRARVRILLETTAGQGTSLGYRFEQLAEILGRVEAAHRVGICLDTCHLFAAGYDLRSAAGYRATMRELEACLGCQRVQAVHLNDSRRELGSRVDRHEHIGEGHLGLSAFGHILTDPRFQTVPMILETPKGADATADDRRNLARLRGLLDGGNHRAGGRSLKRPGR